MCSRRWRCLVLILASSPHSIGTGVPPVPAAGGGPGGVDAAAPYLVLRSRVEFGFGFGLVCFGRDDDEQKDTQRGGGRQEEKVVDGGRAWW